MVAGWDFGPFMCHHVIYLIGVENNQTSVVAAPSRQNGVILLGPERQPAYFLRHHIDTRPPAGKPTGAAHALRDRDAEHTARRPAGLGPGSLLQGGGP